MSNTTQISSKYSHELNLIIKNPIFHPDILKTIKPLGFAVFTYILIESRGTLDANITISLIQKKLNIKTKQPIINAIENLAKTKYITIQSQSNETYTITLEMWDSIDKEICGYTYIPAKEFYNNYIDENSWLIYIFLNKWWNKKYKSAKITYSDLQDKICISYPNAIQKSLQQLQDKKLIQITTRQKFRTPDKKFSSYSQEYRIPIREQFDKEYKNYMQNQP